MHRSGFQKYLFILVMAVSLVLTSLISFTESASAGSEDEMHLENTIYRIEDTDQPGVKKYVMEADLKATPAQVCGVVCDYYHMHTFMPKEFSSKVVRAESNQITLDVTLDLPWPFRDLKSLLLVEFNKQQGNAEWKLIGGNIERNDGTIHVEQRGEFSHLKQVTYLNIGRYYPDWFIKIYTRSLTYKVMRAIRERVEMEVEASHKSP